MGEEAGLVCKDILTCSGLWMRKQTSQAEFLTEGLSMFMYSEVIRAV